jgi:hypothetical protein
MRSSHSRRSKCGVSSQERINNWIVPARGRGIAAQIEQANIRRPDRCLRHSEAPQRSDIGPARLIARCINFTRGSGAAMASRQISEQIALRSPAYRFTQTISAEGCGEPEASGHIALPSPNVTTDP